MQRAPGHRAVGPGEVDELEDAQRRARALELHALAAQAVLLVDDDDLAGLDIIGADFVRKIQPGGLAADHGVSLVAAEAERTYAVGVAEADQSVARYDRRREGAADLGDGHIGRRSGRLPRPLRR